MGMDESPVYIVCFALLCVIVFVFSPVFVGVGFFVVPQKGTYLRFLRENLPTIYSCRQSSTFIYLD